MKIATFNINNVNRRLPNLIRWLKASEPDVVCLQETKSNDLNFPAEALREVGYQSVFRGDQTWNGVAILAKDVEPVLTRKSLPGDRDDRQSRYIEAAVKGILIGCIYLPNGNPQPGPKFEYKLAWFERLIAHARELWAANVPIVLAGDYNVIPTDSDVYNTRSWLRNALLQPEPRRCFKCLIDAGWTDALRTLHPDKPMYTFWHYLRQAWPRDAGMRLDHLVLSGPAAMRLKNAGVDREVRGEEGASDHAPAWIELS
jgi:exodeoxyribonuclease-3